MKGFFEYSTKFSLIAASLLAAGCANSPSTDMYSLGQSNLVSSSLTGGTTSSSCSVQPNVLPINDTHLNGSDRYQVCPNTTTPTTVVVNGFTDDGDQICVFPAENTDLGVSPITNVTIQCPKISASGMTVSYPNAIFNSVFIVASKYSAQMYQCLTVGGTCPPYSYGQFK